MPGLLQQAQGREGRGGTVGDAERAGRGGDEEQRRNSSGHRLGHVVDRWSESETINHSSSQDRLGRV